MAEEIRSVWPKVIDTKVLSPIAILRRQASALGEGTKGLLEGDIKTWTAKDGDTVYDFQIIAPPLERYTYLLFQMWHKKEFVYPVTIKFKPWQDEAQASYVGSRPGRFALPDEIPSGLRDVATPKDMLDQLEQLFNSTHTRGVLMSLIARINDAELEGSRKASNEQAGEVDTAGEERGADAEP